MSKRPIREEIQWRGKVTFALVFVIGSLIAAQIVVVQNLQKKKWMSKVLKVEHTPRRIKAVRGNIYASDGKSLLATSVPRYRVGLDPTRASKKYFDERIDTLCYRLSNFFQDRSPSEYKELIIDSRKAKKTMFVAFGNRLIDFQEKQIIKQFPFFRDGAMKTGGKFVQEERRVMPFGNMALRTIGKLDRKTQSRGDFGMEYSFNNYLAGRDGIGFYQRLAGGSWKPVEDSPEVRPEAGLDIISTIDVNYQDIVESALHEQVINKNAKYGSAVVMEVATGEIKAITNLTRRNDSTRTFYVEELNHAVLGGTDPGSTFKLATMVALLEKTNLNLNDYAGFCNGKIMHNNVEMRCSDKHGNLTIQQTFEQSCNIGIYHLVRKYFKAADEYLAYMSRFKLDKPLGFQIKGESPPIIVNRKSKTFSSTTIPWMSIGYETRLTPLQMLTFYNAIANRGIWVQPIIVKEVRDANRTIEKFEANRDDSPICSERTIKLVHQMMMGVVENGTAKNINSGYCKVAGKTGTSEKRESGYISGKYYTAFIGFFPADNPKYSCVVVIDEPQEGNLNARDVAAPVFRKIADKIFAYDVKMHSAKNKSSVYQLIAKQQNAGYAEDFRTVSEKLNLLESPTQADWVKAHFNNNKIVWKIIPKESVGLPNVMGMTLRDATHLLENKGYKVKFSGLGKVINYAISEPRVVSLILN